MFCVLLKMVQSPLECQEPSVCMLKTNRLQQQQTSVYQQYVYVGDVLSKGLPSHAQLSSPYLLSSLNITHMINTMCIRLSKLSTRIPFGQVKFHHFYFA